MLSASSGSSALLFLATTAWHFALCVLALVVTQCVMLYGVSGKCLEQKNMFSETAAQLDALVFRCKATTLHRHCNVLHNVIAKHRHGKQRSL